MTADERPALLRSRAAAYARTGLAVITQEYPNDLRHTTTGPDDRPRPHDIHPSFYGSFDWHSCVEMHWLLVRLLREAPEDLPQAEIRGVLSRHLDATSISVETAYLAAHPGFKRPYGWGWALMLANETASWDDPDAARWAAALAPLAKLIRGLYLAWLPRATYPDRYGLHNNGAFGLSLAWPYAEARAAAGEPALLAALTEATHRWFGADESYPAGWEPLGADFLSPALVEAELMARAVQPRDFADWLDRFLPDLASGRPASLFIPATVSDSADGQIAHLHGLNLSRAWAWRRIAAVLAEGDSRTMLMSETARAHAAAALDEATGGDYMVEHWLACYAVLYLSSL